MYTVDMKVCELIAELQKLPPDDRVIVWGLEECTDPQFPAIWNEWGTYDDRTPAWQI